MISNQDLRTHINNARDPDQSTFDVCLISSLRGQSTRTNRIVIAFDTNILHQTYKLCGVDTPLAIFATSLICIKPLCLVFNVNKRMRIDGRLLRLLRSLFCFPEILQISLKQHQGFNTHMNMYVRTESL